MCDPFVSYSGTASRQSVIISGCCARPDWLYMATGHERFYELTDYFVNDVLEPEKRDIDVRALISGDKHFYARHQRAEESDGPETLIVAGGGGAYLSSSKMASEQVYLPGADGRRSTRYDEKQVWPTRREMDRLVWRRIFRQLPLKNGFLPLVGALLYLVFALPLWLRLGGPAFWSRTEGHPDYPEARYRMVGTTVPRVRRRR